MSTDLLHSSNRNFLSNGFISPVHFRKLSIPQSPSFQNVVPADTSLGFKTRKPSMASPQSDLNNPDSSKNLKNWKLIPRPDVFSQKIHLVGSTNLHTKCSTISPIAIREPIGKIRKALENKVRSLALTGTLSLPSPTKMKITPFSRRHPILNSESRRFVKQVLQACPKKFARWKRYTDMEKSNDQFLDKLSSCEYKGIDELEKLKGKLVTIQKSKYTKEMQALSKINNKESEIQPFSFDDALQIAVEKSNEFKMQESKYVRDFDNDVKMRVVLNKRDSEKETRDLLMPASNHRENYEEQIYLNSKNTKEILDEDKKRMKELFKNASLKIHEIEQRHSELSVHERNIGNPTERGKDLILAVKRSDQKYIEKLLGKYPETVNCSDRVFFPCFYKKDWFYTVTLGMQKRAFRNC